MVRLVRCGADDLYVLPRLLPPPSPTIHRAAKRSTVTLARRSFSTSRNRPRQPSWSRSASTRTLIPTARPSATSGEIGRFSDDHYEADGFYREYYPNGQKFVEGQYKDGHQEGTWTYYHDNGKVQRTVTYSNGQPDGSWDVYNAEGAVVAKRGYKSGKRDGTWVVYDESGKQPLREEVYTDGKANGVWKVWFPSGQQKNEISVKDGVRDGPYAEWDEKGNKRLDLNFADGKLDGTATLLGADGQKVVQHYDHGKLLKDAKE